MTHLLDANALIALCWPTHEHHRQMLAWFRQHAQKGWATTALTQGAFVRIVSRQVFARRTIVIGEVAELLMRNTAHSKHRLVPLDVEFADVMVACTCGILGHRQVTVSWLLTAAIRGGNRLLTFDSGIGQLLATARARRSNVASTARLLHKHCYVPTPTTQGEHPWPPQHSPRRARSSFRPRFVPGTG